MKLDSIVVNKIVTGVSVISYGKTICFTYTDGSVEYRDRFTMEELYTDVNLSRINSILEVGFAQRGDHLCKYPSGRHTLVLLTNEDTSSPDGTFADQLLCC